MSSDEDHSSSGSEEEDELGDLNTISDAEQLKIQQRTGKRRNSISAESTASVMCVVPSLPRSPRMPSARPLEG